MRLSPLDIQNHRFGQRLRGYDPEEVDAFNRMVAEDFEHVIREADGLRDRIRELEARVQEMASREETLRNTLVTAQQVSEDLRRTAAREAEVVLAEAEVKAEKVLDAAHRRVAKLAEDIREMRQLRVRLAASVRAAIETHLALLEGLAGELPEDPLLDGKVAFMASKAAKRSPEATAPSIRPEAAQRPAAPPTRKNEAGGT
jgi:cell division initiation protein